MVPVKPRSSKPLLQQQQLLDPPLFQCIFNITALCCNTAATFSTLQRAGMNLLQHINCSTTPACCLKELLLSLNSPDKNITAEMPACICLYQIYQQVQQTQITSVKIAVVFLFKYTSIEVINRVTNATNKNPAAISEKREKLDSLPRSLVCISKRKKRSWLLETNRKKDKT